MSDTRPGLKFLAFALVCAACAAWLISVTGNIRFFSDTFTYTAELEDATGLAVRDSVRLAGVRVGTVEGITIERGNAVVTFSADKDVTLRDTWEVGARWRNVIGQRYLYLYPTGAGAPLEPGGRLPVEQSRPTADIGLFFERLTPLLRAIDPEQQNKVVAALNMALDGKEARTQQLVADLGSLTGTLADREDQIRRVIGNGTALLDSLARRDEQIRAFIDDLADVSTTLAARDDELVGAVADIAEAQAQLGALLEANDAELRAITEDLDTLTATLGRHREELEGALATTKDGLAVYMLISRWGQWFNVRAVAVQVQDDGQVIFCRTEANTPCSDPNAAPGGQGASRPAAAPAPPAGGGAPAVSRAPERLDGLQALVGTALGDRPGSGLVYAADRAGGGAAE